MKLLSKLSIIAGAAALATPMLTAQTTEVATIPVGVVEMTIPAGNTLVAPLFVNPNEFQGAAVSVTENSGTSTIVFGSDVFTAGTFDESDFPLFYAEVVGGDNEGFGFDIISNTTNSITVSGDILADTGISQTETFAIRQHISLSQLFESAENISSYDSVKFFNSDGTQSEYFYLPSGWTDFTNNVDNKQIYPSTGFVATLQSQVTLTSTGTVKSTFTRVPVYAGVINLSASGSPVEKTLGSTDIGPDMNSYESIKLFVPGTLGVQAELFWDGSKWTDFSSDAGGTELKSGSAYVVTVQADHYVNYSPAYTE